MNTSQYRKIKAFGNIVRQEASKEIEHCRDLRLLENIQGTIDALDVDCLRIQQANQFAAQIIGYLDDNELVAPEGCAGLASLLEAARDLVEQAYDKLNLKHICAANDPELQEDDGVVDAYAHLLAEVAVLHERLNTLYWIIREQEADQDITLPGEFSDADDLFAAMGV